MKPYKIKGFCSGKYRIVVLTNWVVYIIPDHTACMPIIAWNQDFSYIPTQEPQNKSPSQPLCKRSNLIVAGPGNYPGPHSNVWNFCRFLSIFSTCSISIIFHFQDSKTKFGKYSGWLRHGAQPPVLSVCISQLQPVTQSWISLTSSDLP